ncbi:MAG: CD3072 family TudS-related putative desulfidase [Thermoplasmatota archaeon]
MMFKDNRSKKIVLVSHCILNQNSISNGTADFPGTFREIVDIILEKDIGIIQMPCPELLCLGLDRGDPCGAEKDVVIENTRIGEALKEEPNSKKMRSLVNKLVYQIQEYIQNDFSIIGIIGVNRSPSCGVETTSMNNKEVEGEGIFINALEEKLNEKDIDIEMIGVKTSEVDNSVEKVRKLLKDS